jgi:histidine triad (HIT) family protein
MLSDEEMREIKQRIISHIESTFPIEQIDNAKQQIESMNHEQFESFLKRNKIIKTENSDSESDNECVFCSIVSGKINSVKLDENEDAVAVLEINPISKGHTIIIPKKHTDNSKKALSLAQKISKKLKKKLLPKDIEISTSNLFGHEIINVLPVYKNENIHSKRNSIEIEELEKLKEEIERESKRKKTKKGKTEEAKQFFWLPKRIP